MNESEHGDQFLQLSGCCPIRWIVKRISMDELHLYRNGYCRNGIWIKKKGAFGMQMCN